MVFVVVFVVMPFPSNYIISAGDEVVLHLRSSIHHICCCLLLQVLFMLQVLLVGGFLKFIYYLYI